MTLESLGDVEALVRNENLPDKDAQRLIDTAVDLAASEVYQRLTHARQIELDNQKLCKERTARQEAVAESERGRLELERQEGLRRQAELKSAEDKNGPRRGHSGSGW